MPCGRAPPWLPPAQTPPSPCHRCQLGPPLPCWAPPGRALAPSTTCSTPCWCWLRQLRRLWRGAPGGQRLGSWSCRACWARCRQLGRWTARPALGATPGHGWASLCSREVEGLAAHAHARHSSLKTCVFFLFSLVTPSPLPGTCPVCPHTLLRALPSTTISSSLSMAPCTRLAAAEPAPSPLSALLCSQ